MFKQSIVSFICHSVSRNKHIFVTLICIQTDYINSNHALDYALEKIPYTVSFKIIYIDKTQNEECYC